MNLIIEEFKLDTKNSYNNSINNITDFNDKIKFNNVSFSYSDEKNQ